MTVQKKVTEYKLRLNDKAACFEEMYAKALLLIGTRSSPRHKRSSAKSILKSSIV